MRAMGEIWDWLLAKCMRVVDSALGGVVGDELRSVTGRWSQRVFTRPPMAMVLFSKRVRPERRTWSCLDCGMRGL